jgi:hypothetical protein
MDLKLNAIRGHSYVRRVLIAEHGQLFTIHQSGINAGRPGESGEGEMK